MFAEHPSGWVFLGFPDEALRRWLRAGTVRLWSDARSISKVEGQSVLFLQLGKAGAHWEGAGRIEAPEERWRQFGVRVRCTQLLPHPLPAVPATVSEPTATGNPSREPRIPSEDLWENRALASLVGLHRFRSRTPYLEDSRDLRLSDSDVRLLRTLQPGIEPLLNP